MEPYAGAWRADEPTLDFSRLTAPDPRERTRAEARAPELRTRPTAGETSAVALPSSMGAAAIASVDVQSAAAALIAVPAIAFEPPAAALAQTMVVATVSPAAAKASPLPADPHPTHADVADVDSSSAPPTATDGSRPLATDGSGATITPTPSAPETDPGSIFEAPLPVAATTPPIASDPTIAVIPQIESRPWTSSSTTYAADGSVVSVDLYGFARVFDHVRLDYRADGTLATRTLLDTENPTAAIVIDYDEAGAAVARHELNLPDRPYARVDILYGTDGAVAERTRSGFASGDVASITVRFDAHGAIVEVEHLQRDGSRTVIGTAGADRLAGHGGDLLVGHGDADTFVLLDSAAPPLAIADFHAAQGDRLDLSHVLGSGHFLGESAFDGAAGAVRFEHVGAGVLVTVDTNGDRIADAGVLLAGVHTVAVSDLIF